MSTEKDQSKGSKYLEQELANFLSKGLENKYFRLRAKKVKSKILCTSLGFKCSVFITKINSQDFIFSPQPFKKTFFSLQIIQEQAEAVFGPKAIVCPLLAQSIALYNFLWWWKSVCIVPNKRLLSIWNVATVTEKLNFKLDLILITVRQPFKTFYEFKERV